MNLVWWDLVIQVSQVFKEGLLLLNNVSTTCEEVIFSGLIKSLNLCRSEEAFPIFTQTMRFPQGT